jgi:hypothetical protein
VEQRANKREREKEMDYDSASKKVLNLNFKME